MSGRLLRSIFVAALVAAVVARLLARRPASERPDVSRHPSNDGGARTPLAVVPPAPTWVEPVEGACPEGYPVKGKLRSGIYHLPGMLAYDRTGPDRCYRSAADAEADGLRAAKR